MYVDACVCILSAVTYLSLHNQHTHVKSMPSASQNPYCDQSVSVLVINWNNSLPTKQHIDKSIGFKATYKNIRVQLFA